MVEVTVVRAGFKEPAAIRKMGNLLNTGSVTGNKSKYPTRFHSEKPFDSDPRKKMKLLSSSGIFKYFLLKSLAVVEF